MADLQAWPDYGPDYGTDYGTDYGRTLAGPWHHNGRERFAGMRFSMSNPNCV